MKADLHLHSLCSDGALTPAAIARRAKEAGLGLFSLTDHDTLAGNREAAAAAKALGIRFVPGIEISAYRGATKTHILGYGCEEGEAYAQFLRARTEGAMRRAQDSLQKANEYFGLHLTIDDVEAYHVRKEAPIHTMHVVRTFAARLARSVEDLYREAFAPHCPAFSDLCRPTPEEAVSTVRAMGGLAVVAHPAQILVLPEEVSRDFHNYTEEEKERAKITYRSGRTDLLLELVRAGIDGIECHHSTHTAEETGEFLAFARSHGRFVTGGSDFHADGMGRSIGVPDFDAAPIAERLLALGGSV